MAKYPRASDSKELLLLLDRIGAENETVSQTQTDEELMEGVTQQEL